MSPFFESFQGISGIALGRGGFSFRLAFSGDWIGILWGAGQAITVAAGYVSCFQGVDVRLARRLTKTIDEFTQNLFWAFAEITLTYLAEK
ncbi:MAG: hypothetical protein ACJAVK_000402 [Akkermansiaceae bacterium]